MPEQNYEPDPRAKPLSWTPSRGFGPDGGGGEGQVLTGAAAPASPDDPASAAVFYATGGGPLLQWDVASQAWV